MNWHRRQLEQELFQHFANKGAPLLSNKHLAALTEEAYHSVEDIFQARYDSEFLENIPSRHVLEKMLGDLENITAACSKIKLNSKNKASILQNGVFLDHCLNLLFTQKEKQVLQKLINHNFQQEEQDPDHSIEVIAYILKAIFGMGQQAVEEVQGGCENYGEESFDFD